MWHKALRHGLRTTLSRICDTGTARRRTLPDCDDGCAALPLPSHPRSSSTLVTNAIKFTPARGLIVIKCTSDGAFVRIAVQDTGIGIPAGEQELIFEPFMQVQRGGVPGNGSGIGLGLAISRELVTSMGGEISVASEVDAGCTFTVFLPKAPSLGITSPGT